MLPVGPAWLTFMCDAGSCAARWAGGLKRVSKAVAVARRAPRQQLYQPMTTSMGASPCANEVTLSRKGVAPADPAESAAIMAQPAMPICCARGKPGRSHSCSFDQRRRPETLRTAMATAFMKSWITIHRHPATPKASLIRSPGVSYTVKMDSLWGLLMRAVTATSAR
jgi:hypothetical protein